MKPQRHTSLDISAETTGERYVPTTQADTAKIQETVEARDALADALTQAGIQLPAMDVRTPWQDVVGDDDSDFGSAARYALIHLGVCSAPVAFALAAVIVKGVGR
jgi:hypothetical protein